MDNGVYARWPGDTRPLSIVDASNRILAVCILKYLEAILPPHICDAQRCFLKHRHISKHRGT